ncbi:hypothetical protein ACOSZF_18425 [Cytobacillus firmus]|nr:hypothetical protein [Cytobacillus firmus]MED1941439.1 hypothetical protein [Cytobacillus firmus]
MKVLISLQSCLSEQCGTKDIVRKHAEIVNVFQENIHPARQRHNQNDQ